MMTQRICSQVLWCVICVLGLGLMTLVCHQPATAQSIFGTIVGTVTDASNAVVPGAKVKVTNIETNERREFTTNESGNFELNNLFPGRYLLEGEMAGFANFRQEGMQLAANQNLRVDFTLQVATGVTGITVSAESAGRIETETAKLSDIRSTMQLRSLPLADRSVYRFLVLTPGVTGGMNGTMSVSGSRDRQVHYAVDGVTMADVRSSNTIGPTLNFIESFDEAKIDFGNNSAEFKALGTLTMVSKRGSNEVHGAVYDYYSTGAFRARDYFTGSRSGTPSHAFGGHIGGPVYLPKIYNGRNKTFFLSSYETTFAPQGSSNLTPSVPLAAWKRGDFSGLSTTIRDPFSGTPFVSNVIPPDRISNVAKQYLPLWPDPNYGNPNVFASLNYRTMLRRPPSKPHNAQFRVDHRISDNNTVFGRYLHQRQQNPAFESGLPGTLGLTQQLRVVKHFMVSDTHIFSPTLINEFRFGIAFNTNPYYAASVNGAEWIQKTGLTNVTRDGKIPDIHEVPCLSFSQGAGIQGICVTNQRYFNGDLTYQWQDTVSKIAGKHSIRAGFEINQWYFIDQNQASNVLGSFDFSNRFTGYNFADFLLGIPSSMSRTPYAVKRQDLSVGYDFFFQDNYKVTNSLTLNLGLRYEYHLPWDTSGARLSAFDVKTGSIVVPDKALPLVSDLFPTNLVPVIGNSKTAFNNTLMRTDKNNFAPRFGFAWRPFGAKTFVVRGGYGIFYDIIVRQPTRWGPPFVVSEPSYTNPADVKDPGFVQWPLAFPKTVRGAGVSVPGTYEIGFKTPYAQNWNLTLEKEIGVTRLRASYVGTGGRQMQYPFNINQPAPGPGAYIDKPRLFPTLSDITINKNGASHTYHAMNLQVERNFIRGLLFNSAFTWAKDLGNEDVTPENTYNLAVERGQTQFQPFRRWVGFFIYELPFGRGKRIGSNLTGLGRHVLSGWELSASASMQSGQNETPLWQGPDVHGISYTTSRTAPNVARRPNCLANPNLPSDQRTISAWYNINVFSLPATAGAFGTCGRGIIDGPGVQVLHGGLFKRFQVAERFNLRFGTQMTNILNHPNWSSLGSGALRLDNTSSRGRITGAGGATSGSAGDAAGSRVIRVDLRVEF